MRALQLAIKRILDVILSGIGLVLLSPIFLAIALAIRFSSPGPIFFRQERLGRDATVFRIFKFRTMMDKAPDIRNADGSTFTGSVDPRVTGIGKLLRKTSLDELPQLINVFIGDMSLVGPRPDLAKQLELYEPHERRKLDLRPGMTGWAMVLGRNSLTWKRRKELDIYYVENFSLWFDLMILLRTIPAVVFGVGVIAEQPGPAKDA
jgi:undecaprenyl phosphate N,N'-diacetylbacillosamine 1-phosphate transferase